MAFYVPHAGPKSKIDGFQPPQATQQQHQPPFDPSSLFFSGPVFPDPFRHPNAGNQSMDFSDTLMGMIPNSNGANPPNEPHHNNGNPQLSLNMYQMANYPSFHGGDAPMDSPSLYDSKPPPNTATSPYASSVPAYMNNHRPDTPSSPSDAPSPYPTHASHARMHGHRSPSISGSRSRSRSKPATVNRKVPNAKRPSLSEALPEPSRPQAIVIPNPEFAQGLNSLGPHPISPLGIHSTQTAPSTWFVPSSAGAYDGGLPPTTNSFGQSGRSLSLGGGGPKPGTSASASVLAGKEDAASKQAAILNEKRRRRRESHNAVERRRRDNINEKISELSTLLPDCMLEVSPPSGSPAVGTGDGEGDDGKETPAMKANKGIILRKSVEYIRYLQQLVQAQASRNRDLETELSQYRTTSTPNSSSNGYPNLSSLGMLDHLAGIDEEYVPNKSDSPLDDEVDPVEGEEEEERGRGLMRGGRVGGGYGSSASVGKVVREKTRERSEESRERMME